MRAVWSLGLYLVVACDGAPEAPAAAPSAGSSSGPTNGAAGMIGGTSSSAPGDGVPALSGGGASGGETGSRGGSASGGGSGYAGTSGGAGATGGQSAAGGESAAGGQASTQSGGVSAQAGSAAFTLLYRDDFDTLDLTRWQLMTHSWDSNLALFSAQAVSVQDGFLAIELMAAPNGTVDDAGVSKPYLGAEVRSLDTLTYGRVRARAKLAAGSAVISSLVTIYTPWPADNWNELDIECLGKAPTALQYNAMVYTGPPTTPPVTTAVSPTQDPYIDSLGFDASADFHVYSIEWTPEAATFSIDDVPRHSWTRNIALMTLPQNVLMTIWASSSADWAGAVGGQTLGARATYDWIELYRYTSP